MAIMESSETENQSENMEAYVSEETTLRIRSVSEEEAKDFERREWELAKREIDWYFVPKLLEYDRSERWYVPYILNWHTPNVFYGGIMFSVSVIEEEVHSNDDAGWISRPSNQIQFNLGQDSFIGMKELYSTEVADRNSDNLYHLHIDPATKSVLLDVVTDPSEEYMRQWLIKNDMHGVVYQRKLNPDTFGPRVVLKRFQKDDCIIEMDEEINNATDIEKQAMVDEIKSKLGL